MYKIIPAIRMSQSLLSLVFVAFIKRAFHPYRFPKITRGIFSALLSSKFTALLSFIKHFTLQWLFLSRFSILSNLLALILLAILEFLILLSLGHFAISYVLCYLVDSCSSVMVRTVPNVCPFR